MARFPSLLHLAVGCELLLQDLRAGQLPPLSSFTVHGVLDADLIQVSTRTLLLSCPDVFTWQVPRDRLPFQLTCLPAVQQWAISDLSQKLLTATFTLGAANISLVTSSRHRTVTQPLYPASSTSNFFTTSHSLTGTICSYQHRRPSSPLSSPTSR